MKIAYLHGLESSNQDPKNTWLRTIADAVYDPQIDYRQPGIYRTLLEEIREFNPDLIMGSSMGGYFAYKISKTLDVPAILFNPALHSRTLEPDIVGSEKEIFCPKTLYVFGKNDEVIHPDITINKLNLSSTNTNSYYLMFNYGHRTPIDVFKVVIRQFIQHDLRK